MDVSQAPQGDPAYPLTEFIATIDLSFFRPIKLYYNRSGATRTLELACYNPGDDAVAHDAGNATTLHLTKRVGNDPGAATTLGSVSNASAGLAASTDVAFIGAPVSIAPGESLWLTAESIGTGTVFPAGSTVEIRVL